MVGPHIPERHILARCPHCSRLVWLDHLPTVTYESRPGCLTSVLRLWSRGREEPCLPPPTLSDCWEAVKQTDLEPFRLRYLRQRIWWLSNDPRRRDPAGPLPEQREQDNLLAYLELLQATTDNSSCYQRVEVLRHLGRFEEAIQALKLCNPDNFVTQILRDLIAQRDQVVRPLPPGRP